MKIKGVNEIKEENRILNKYLIICWGAMVCCYFASYTVERAFDEISIAYYTVFLILLLVPYGSCLLFFFRSKDNYWIRYTTCLGYMIMYGFTLFTGVTARVYVFIMPFVVFLVLYHDVRLVLSVGATGMALNIISVGIHFSQGKITESNLYAYEIQLLITAFCFGGAIISSWLYNSICEKGEQRLQDMLEAQKEKTILEERNRYLLTDALTGFGTRRAYEESLNSFRENMPEQLSMAVMDINDLKGANDRYGHSMGDELISRAAGYIKRIFHSDNYGLDRVGGDEFVVIGRCSKQNLDMRLSDLLRTIEISEVKNEIRVATAVGSASTDESGTAGESLEDIFDRADKRMYENKKKHYQSMQYDRRSRRD